MTPDAANETVIEHEKRTFLADPECRANLARWTDEEFENVCEGYHAQLTVKYPGSHVADWQVDAFRRARDVVKGRALP